MAKGARRVKLRKGLAAIAWYLAAYQLPQARGIMTWMLAKDDGTWRIAAFQNTRIEAPPPDLLME